MRRSWVLLSSVLVLFGCKDDEPAQPTPSTSATEAGTMGSDTISLDSSASSSGAADGSTGVPAGCGSATATALTQCVEAEPIAQDVAFIADLRTPGSPHWQAVQELCSDRLTMLGFDVELHEYGTGTNVIGRLPGADSPDELVLIGAHYDHIDGCLGADDNASGVAGALEAARVLASADGRARTLAVACWDEEELGLVGSTAWVDGGQVTGETVAVYFNYDMIGYASSSPDTQGIPMGFDAVFPDQYQQVVDNDFRADFILAVSDDLSIEAYEAYEAHAGTLELPFIGTVLDSFAKNSDLFADLRRSDHAAFWGADIPAIFLTDSGEFRNSAYHCMVGEDSVDALDFDFSRQVVAATVGAAAQSLGVAP